MLLFTRLFTLLLCLLCFSSRVWLCFVIPSVLRLVMLLLCFPPRVCLTRQHALHFPYYIPASPLTPFHCWLRSRPSPPPYTLSPPNISPRSTVSASHAFYFNSFPNTHLPFFLYFMFFPTLLPQFPASQTLVHLGGRVDLAWGWKFKRL